MGGVFVVFLLHLQIYLCWHAYRVLGIYLICFCSQTGTEVCCVAALLW